MIVKDLVTQWRKKEPKGVLSELGLRAEQERLKCADEVEAVLASSPPDEPPCDSCGSEDRAGAVTYCAICAAIRQPDEPPLSDVTSWQEDNEPTIPFVPHAAPDEPLLSAYLKDGETAAECIARNRADVDTALAMLVKEKHKAEALEAEIAEAREACPVVRRQDYFDAPLKTLIEKEVSMLIMWECRAHELQQQLDETRRERDAAHAHACELVLELRTAQNKRD